jgi:hypothetical protein
MLVEILIIKQLATSERSNNAIIHVKKTKAVPCKADPEKQAEFVKELEKLFNELSNNEVVYFNDAVHPQHNTRPD